jgi:hypothetical protein
MSRILSWILASLLFLAILVAAAVVAAGRSKRRTECAPVLDREMARWAAKSYGQLLSELSEGDTLYEVEFESTRYQVEVELLENTPAYLHVAVAVDDESLPTWIVPLSNSFLCRKDDSGCR